MLSQIIDVTLNFNTTGKENLDISGWDYVVIQFESPTGAINFNHTNDAGAVTGVTDGNASTSTGYQPVQAINLATGTGVTSASASGLFQFKYIGRFLQLIGSSVTASKILVYLNKVG